MSGILGAFLCFIFGTIIGSFLNVVIARYNSGHTLGGRSMCLSCGKTLRAGELVPLFSFIALKGRCRGCGTAISFQYPTVEFAAGLAFLGIYLEYLLPFGFAAVTIAYSALAAAVWSVLIVIAAYDLKHKIIPDLLVFLFTALSLASAAVQHGSAFFLIHNLVYGLFAGPIVALPFALLWLASNGRWIGLGDAKLALGIGWLLGLAPAISALLLAFWIGAFFSIVLLLVQKLPPGSPLRRLKPFSGHISAKTEIPFAPFLILGCALVFFFGITVITF